MKGLGRGAFETQTTGERVRFVAELDIGSDAPIIGWTFDKIFQLFFKARLASMQQHMRDRRSQPKGDLGSAAVSSSSRKVPWWNIAWEANTCGIIVWYGLPSAARLNLGFTGT